MTMTDPHGVNQILHGIDIAGVKKKVPLFRASLGKKTGFTYSGPSMDILKFFRLRERMPLGLFLAVVPDL